MEETDPADEREDPYLDYETQDVDGNPRAVYHHVDRDETRVGSELGEVDDTDEWEMRWYCPTCGADDPPDDELKSAGWTSLHVPCAADADIERAELEEYSVATNLRNARAFESGAYDLPGGGR